MSFTSVRSGVFAVLVTVGAASWADTAVSYGKITAVKPTKIEDTKMQVGGALVGGLLGLVSGQGQSGSNKVLRTAGGGLAGQQLGKLASSKQAYEYTILIGGASTPVITDEAGLRVGDCVAVERGAHTNLRLSPDAQCAPKARPVSTATRDANACTAAKNEVVKAQTDEAFDRAERKMRLLCVD